MSVVVPIKPDRNPVPNPPPVPQKLSKLVFLDNLKVFLTLLVILHHAAITYGGSGGWFYQEVKHTVLPDSLVLTAFVATNQCYFMGLFFFISGCFVTASIARKSPWRFAFDKLVRLGVPILLFVFLLYPLTIWLGYYPFSWSSFKANMPQLLADVNPGHTGPCWFVVVLLLFTVLALLLRKPLFALSERMPALRAGDYLLVGIVIGMVSFVTRLVFPDGYSVVNVQLSYMPQYLFYFFAGVVMGTGRVVQLAASQRVMPWLIPSVLMMTGLMIALAILLDTKPFVGGTNPYAIYYSMVQGFMSVALSIVALVLCYRHANHNDWWGGFLSKGAYGAFFIHAPVLVGLTLLLQPISLMPMLKFVLLGCLGVPLSFVLGHMLASMPGLRRVF